MFINFSDIPGHQNLFLDYMYEYENVSRFYKQNFRDKDEYQQLFKSVSEQSKDFREDLSEIISGQYTKLSPSTKTVDNIKKLSSKETLAIVTGQQLGILGGPLYTFYKIITAIKLSRYLSERYDDYNFVPVFWLEGDDHDFEEISSINIIDKENNLKNILYDSDLNENEDRGSVGYIKLTEQIYNFLASVDDNLRTTDFTPHLLDKLKSFYVPGKSFKDAFKELIFWLFDKYGLVMFDPQDPEIKTILKPIFKKEITDFRNHTEKLVNVSAQLEESYHAQVKVQPINLFYSTEEGRYLIEPVENEFRLKRKRKKFSYDELIEEIETNPEKFSPNVLLRPICQDFLLPTAFYIGGPSEIAYFAQVTPLYDFYNIHSPVIYPRSSVSIVEKNITSIIDKYDINIQDLYYDPEALKTKIINANSVLTVEDIFNESTKEIELALESMREKLFEIDKTLSDAGKKYKQKIFHYIDELKEKAVEAQKKKHETIVRQIDKVSAMLYPESNLQERELNFVYYANKYGSDFVNKIFDEIEINQFEHQLIKL